jgi:DNA-binding transcriptional regulator YhcF (GntR family)
VPSVVSVAEEHGVSKSTAHQALLALVELRVISTDGTRGNLFRGQRHACEVLKGLANERLDECLSDLALSGATQNEVYNRVTRLFQESLSA